MISEIKLFAGISFLLCVSFAFASHLLFDFWREGEKMAAFLYFLFPFPAFSFSATFFMGKTRKKRVEGSGKRVTANYKD